MVHPISHRLVNVGHEQRQVQDGGRDAELSRDVGPEGTPVPRAHLLPHAGRRRHAEVGVVRVEGHHLGHPAPDLGLCYSVKS